MCVLRMFPDLSLWLTPTDIVHTRSHTGNMMEALLRAVLKPSEGAVVNSSVILHHSKVRPVRLSISHGLVMYLGPRQPSSPPLWEALWLRPSVTFLQQTVRGAPSTPAHSSPAWFQAPVDALTPVLTPFLYPDNFYNCQISPGEPQNKNYRFKETTFWSHCR